VKALGGLPLAIHLAAGHLKLPAQTPRGFLARLRVGGFTLAPADLSPVTAHDIISQTFALSLAALRRQLGKGGARLARAFHALGHAPLAGIGRGLGAALCDLSADDFDRLVLAACRLSLLDYDGPPQRRYELFRVHPLLAELLRAGTDEAKAVARLTAWFVARMPDMERWNEIHDEYEALRDWLDRVPDGDLYRVGQAGKEKWFAYHCGPFASWVRLCERGLAGTVDLKQRSHYLWTLGHLLRYTCEMERAVRVAQKKIALDRERGDDAGVARAYCLLADLLEIQGELSEVLRIRREEELPVYQRLGNEHNTAICWGRIADVLQARGELDEALRIRREDILPVYERLGAVRDLLVCQANIAITLLKRRAPGDREEAVELLRSAKAAAARMRIPEEQTIDGWLQQAESVPAGGGAPGT
jgi:tetratricopeptide (TPR) repeat protein